jgi:hypothetical protein
MRVRSPVALAILSLGTIGSIGLLSRGSYFQPYFGRINPLLAVTLITALGVVSLRSFDAQGWFEIYTRTNPRGLVLSVTIATLFALVAILVDLNIVSPHGFDVPPPHAWLFYPAMANVAEVSFHALPLSLLLVFLSPLFKKLNSNVLVWSCIFLTSLLEPIFQLGLGFSIYVGLYVFAFNLLQLYIFRRYDFVSMYSVRLVYYLQGHIVWSYIRLRSGRG